MFPLGNRRLLPGTARVVWRRVNTKRVRIRECHLDEALNAAGCLEWDKKSE